jgi:hypothetical protein
MRTLGKKIPTSTFSECKTLNQGLLQFKEYLLNKTAELHKTRELCDGFQAD